MKKKKEKKISGKDFPGDPVAKTLHFQFWGAGFDPQSES